MSLFLSFVNVCVQTREKHTDGLAWRNLYFSQVLCIMDFS